MEGKSGQSASASLTPLPGSESGANVRQVIRERERTDGLWGKKTAKGKRNTRSPDLCHAPRAWDAESGRMRRNEGEERPNQYPRVKEDEASGEGSSVVVGQP